MIKSENKQLTVIAEAGVNHNGELSKALQMIDVASDSGANYIKFQTFEVSRLVSASTPLANYQKRHIKKTASQADLLENLALSRDQFRKLKQRCIECGIGFLSTAFDLENLEFLVNELEIPIIKIASGDLTFGPLIYRASLFCKPILLSTGMANLNEIKDALMLIEFGMAQTKGFIDNQELPTKKNRVRYWESRQSNFVEEFVTIMHCTSQYPAPVRSLNLNSLKTIKETFGLGIGYSDHSTNFGVSCAAIAFGSRVIEKHFTLNKNLPGPDHSASLSPEELKTFIKELRDVFIALGSHKKICDETELNTKKVARRGIRAAKKLEKSEFILFDDLQFVRPEEGMSPMETWDILRRELKKEIQSGEPIEL